MYRVAMRTASIATSKQSAAERAPEVELTYNWDPEDYAGGRNFGHLAYKVDDIYAACQTLMDGGVTINRPPRDGNMAFVRSPDLISVELLQKGQPLAPQAQVVREQLFDRQPALRRMRPQRQRGHVRIARRTMHGQQRVAQRREQRAARHQRLHPAAEALADLGTE